MTISSLVLLTNQCFGCVVFSTEKIKSINSFFRLPVVGSRPENGPERLFFCKQDFNSMNMGTYKVQGRNYHWGRRCLVWFSEREKRKNRERERERGHGHWKYLNKLGRLTIYCSFILSNLNYCPITWHFCSEKNTLKMEKNTRTSPTLCL